MKRSFKVLAVSTFVVCLFAANAFAQWGRPNRGNQGGQPRDGACFYRESNFSGTSFCMNAGESMANLPSGFNDHVSSIRIFGRASVSVFENSNFSGPNERFARDMNDLSQIRKRDDPSRTWNDRISSIRVDTGNGNDRGMGQGRDRGWGWGNNGRNQGNNDNYGGFPTWGRGPQPQQGACFYRDSNFRGDYFCVARGETMRSLPSGFNDRISSMRLFGGVRVSVFQDSDFRGPSARLNRNINDFHSNDVRGQWDRNWNDRISSIQVF